MTAAHKHYESSSLLYQDQDILLINKTAGLLSSPDGYNPNLPHIKKILAPHFGELWMVHRLDKETSVVMIFARNEEAHQNLNRAFRNREVNKVYHGLVSPIPQWREKRITLPLQVDADRKHRTRIAVSQGKEARSDCKVLKVFQFGVLMKIKIHTGITHQIRAHLRSEGLSLFGETLYNAGLSPLPLSAPRMMLHAKSIAFNHPSTGKWLNI